MSMRDSANWDAVVKAVSLTPGCDCATCLLVAALVAPPSDIWCQCDGPCWCGTTPRCHVCRVIGRTLVGRCCECHLHWHSPLCAECKEAAS